MSVRPLRPTEEDDKDTGGDGGRGGTGSNNGEGNTQAGILRPGIVHRLDKGTSGLIVVAKDGPTHAGLCEQFAARRG